jgi:hypothetical protein
MPNQRLLNLLLAADVLLVLGAVVTLLPFSSNNIKSDLGYNSLCPFAPWSTLTLLVGAGLVWIIRAYVKTQNAKTQKR